MNNPTPTQTTAEEVCSCGKKDCFAERLWQLAVDGIIPAEHYRKILSFIEEEKAQAKREAREQVLKELEYIEAEEPSNYPSNEGQEAVYGVVDRLKNHIRQSLSTEGEAKD